MYRPSIKLVPGLGDPTSVPEIQHREKYDPKVAGWINVYAGK